MGVLRLTLVMGVMLLVACATGTSPMQTSENEIEVEPPRVPDPPPRYARVEIDSDAGSTVPPGTEEEPRLQIKCGGHEPYVCMLEDGTFRCSDRPCVPSCDRVGCLGGEVCLPCDGGFRCVATGGTC